MAKIKTKNSVSATSSFVEFEPYCEWQKEDGLHTLILHLPDFKKEQLRVQVMNNERILKVSGEKRIEGAQGKRFLKETKLPEGCIINDIKAKFTKGSLHIHIPISQPQRITTPPPQQQNPQLSAPKSQDTTQKNTKLTDPDDLQGLKATSTSDDHRDQDKPKNTDGVVVGSLAKLGQRKLVVWFGIMAIVVMVGVGAFVAYKCTSHPDDCSLLDDSVFN